MASFVSTICSLRVSPDSESAFVVACDDIMSASSFLASVGAECRSDRDVSEAGGADVAGGVLMSNGTVDEGRSGAEGEGRVVMVRALKIAG